MVGRDSKSGQFTKGGKAYGGGGRKSSGGSGGRKNMAGAKSKGPCNHAGRMKNGKCPSREQAFAISYGIGKK